MDTYDVVYASLMNNVTCPAKSPKGSCCGDVIVAVVTTATMT